jgi:DNA-directed RNA polymerase specialized sigma24 family protein
MKERLNINDLITKATKDAIREYDREKRQEQRKKVFQNTRLLLSHYNDLKRHVENAIDDMSKFEAELLDISELERDELYILSIKKSKAKTLIMIAHIEMAMEMLKKRHIQLGTQERYEALKMFYIEEKTYEEIQEHFNCSKNTPGRWINQTINDLSVFLFGIDGLKLDMVQ